MSKLIKKYKSLSLQMRASFWFFLTAFLQKSVTLITTPIFTRLLTEAEYGRFNVFFSWHSIICVFVGLKLYLGMFMQGIVKFEADKSRFVSSMQGLSLTLVTVWSVIFFLFRDFWVGLFSLSETQLFAMLCIIWAGAIFCYWSTQERMELRYKALVTVTLAVSVIQPTVGVFLVLNAKDKVTARIVGIAAVELSIYVWLFFQNMKQGRTFFDRRYWRYALLFSFPLIPHYLAESVLNGADQIMISRIISDDAAGIYSLAYSASHVMTLFSVALTQTIEPWLYKTIKNGRWERFPGIAYPAMALVAVMNLALIAFAPEIISIVAPPSYYDAIWVIPPISMSVFFIFAYSFFASFEFYYEKTLFIAIATVAAAVLNIVLNYICIPVWGYYAAGYTTLFCYAVYATAHYLFMTFISRRQCPGIWVYHPSVLLTISVIFIGTGLTFLALYRHTALRYAFAVLLGGIILLKHTVIVVYIKNLLAIREKRDIT